MSNILFFFLFRAALTICETPPQRLAVKIRTLEGQQGCYGLFLVTLTEADLIVQLHLWKADQIPTCQSSWGRLGNIWSRRFLVNQVWTSTLVSRYFLTVLIHSSEMSNFCIYQSVEYLKDCRVIILHPKKSILYHIVFCGFGNRLVFLDKEQLSCR